MFFFLGMVDASQGAGARRRRARAGGHPAAACADRRRARGARRRPAALRRRGDRAAMAGAQPRIGSREIAAGRRDERHPGGGRRAAGRRMARRRCAPTPRAATCVSGPTPSAIRTTSPMPASGCRRTGCWRGFRTSRRSSISAPASTTCWPIPILPPVPVARVAHPDLTMRVTEYVVLHVLMHHRRQRLYDAQQRERLWRVHDQPAASEVCGRRHGARRDRTRGCGGARAARLRGRGLEPHAEEHCRHRDLSRRGAASTRSWRAPKSWSACCRGRAHTEGILNLALFRKLKRDGAAGGAFLINAGARPAAGRCRHRDGARRRHARRRDARRVSAGAAAVRKPAVDASQGHDHAAQRRRYRAARVRAARHRADRAVRARACRSTT